MNEVNKYSFVVPENYMTLVLIDWNVDVGSITEELPKYFAIGAISRMYLGNLYMGGVTYVPPADQGVSDAVGKLQMSMRLDGGMIPSAINSAIKASTHKINIKRISIAGGQIAYSLDFISTRIVSQIKDGFTTVQIDLEPSASVNKAAITGIHSFEYSEGMHQ